MSLSWRDLLIDSADLDWAGLLDPWAAMLNGQFRPIFMDRLGCIYVERRSGEVEMLDVMFGEMDTVAATREELTALVNDAGWQSVYLASKFVLAMHEAGKKAEAENCYAIAPPPSLGGPDPRLAATGPIDPDRVQVMSVKLWHSMCRQIHGLPA